MTENHLTSAGTSVRQSPPADISVLVQETPSTDSRRKETIETSDEDETQVDSSGNRQVDSGGNRQVDSGGNRQVDSSGNQDQATDQEELNPQGDNIIGPQAKDDPLPGLPTPAQSPEPQLNGTTALSVQVPPPQPPSARAPSAKAPPVQVPLVQAPSVHASSAQPPSA